jgi:hypothetical protein
MVGLARWNEEGTGNEHAARALIGPSFKFHSTVGKVACDSHVEEDASVPILNVDYHHVDVPGTLAARSLGEMVTWWIEALESGAWRYEPERDVWNYREDLVPPERVPLV